MLVHQAHQRHEYPAQHWRDRQEDQDEYAIRLDLRQLVCLAMRQQAHRDAPAIQRRQRQQVQHHQYDVDLIPICAIPSMGSAK